MANDKPINAVNKRSNNKQNIVPKPPTAPKSNNLNARQRIINSPSSSSSLNSSINANDESDYLSNILNTTLSPRPLSSRLSKYSALPQIGTNRNTNLDESQNILIGFRLPNGVKKEKIFNKKDKIDIVLMYAINELEKTESNVTNKLRKSNYTLLQMPNLTIDDLNKTVESYKIENRSMLFLIEKKLL